MYQPLCAQSTLCYLCSDLKTRCCHLLQCFSTSSTSFDVELGDTSSSIEEKEYSKDELFPIALSMYSLDQTHIIHDREGTDTKVWFTNIWLWVQLKKLGILLFLTAVCCMLLGLRAVAYQFQRLLSMLSCCMAVLHVPQSKDVNVVCI